MGFRLTVTRGKSEGKEFSFTKARVRVGRNHDNDLVLYDLNVSRHHFEIIRDGSKHLLRDCGSQNGTKLNDAPALDTPLKDGDRIQLGGLEFEFSGSDTQPAFTMDETTERAELFAPQSPEQRATLEDIRTSAVNIKQLQEMREMRENRTPALNKSIKTEAQKALTSTQKNLPDPNLKKRRVLYPLAGLLAFALPVTAFVVFYPKKQQNLSTQKFPISETVSLKSYGAGRVDFATPEQAQFAWLATGGRTIVHFVAGGIERKDELGVVLNGGLVFYVPVTGQAWGSEVELKLDRKKVKPGEENVIAFVHKRESGEVPRWGVREVWMSETPLPPPSKEEAMDALKLADDNLQNKRIALGNLSAAEENYKRAVLLMEGLDPLPAEHPRAEAAMKAVQAELKNVLQSKMFLAEKAKKLGQNGDAESILKELLLYFPRADDPRRVQVEEKLGALSKAP